MKIITGISNAHKEDEILSYIEAGVDEFFLGYVPIEWSNEYGFELSNNRRETSKFQYKAKDQLANLVNTIHRFNKKVFLTLNAHEYNLNQMKVLMKILENIRDVVFDGFIVSNIGVIKELRRNGFNNVLNISIGAATNNIETIKFFTDNFDNIGRFVLPRKLSIKEIEKIALFAKSNNIRLEAFGMGGPYCAFNDEYCFTWHGAENTCFCGSPMYETRAVKPIVFCETWKDDVFNEKIGNFYNKLSEVMSSVKKQREDSLSKHPNHAPSAYELGILHMLSSLTVCGLCAFQKFKNLDIEAVKLPLRGRYYKNNLFVIGLAKKAITEANSSPDFCRKLMNSPGFCSGKNCYYNIPYST
jgi:collagenase-like PrtC family protease